MEIDPFDPLETPELEIRDPGLADVVSVPNPETASEPEPEPEPPLPESHRPHRATTPLPLTQEEARQVDEFALTELARARTLLGRVDRLETRIGEHLTRKGFSFQVDLSRRPRLRKAVEVLFGKGRDRLTYKMYREALRIKAEEERVSAEDPFTR